MTEAVTTETDTSAQSPARGRAQVFYRFEDENGTLHLSDSLADVPLRAGARVEQVVLDAPASAAPASTPLGTSAPGVSAVGSITVHWPSFGLGLGMALILFGLFSLGKGRGKSRVLIGALSLMGLLALGVGLYLGALRRMAGTKGSAETWLSSPTQIIEDAKRTVEQVKTRRQEQETTLEQIRREGQ